ncbi:alpha/beta hydrolase fold protein [Melanomma pulvis-pyrius CBS 109.77]|uniref:Alpha/beta hydrolase fold protein n=1 Tax=Melanomma pulvis-pyrius CBS 109.77 TaxID=1314802 RepID=A0A6A6X8V4_9PLEO|nr:alpha/beta hydrolase fold protein [Melanomma pulvis-pyrius CBS 109.77]
MPLISNLKAYLLSIFTTTHNPVGTQATLTGDLPKCRFRLDNDSSDILALPDGRKLGYAQYGSLTGRAILYQHGHPGSRLEAARHHELALELGARIIAVDRPGHGWSSPHPNRTILDFPKDLEHLAKHLELASYSVWGISGGGPYALACAVALPPEKLKCVSIVCGMGPPDIGMSGAGWMHWLAYTWGYRYGPGWLGRWWWRRDPLGRLDLTDEQRLELYMQPNLHLNERDHDIMKDKDLVRLVVRSSRESFAQGYDGVWQDGKLMCKDFGFRIQDIRLDLPVQLWYGKYDTYVPLNHGEQIAARLGGRAQLRVEDEAHAGISVHWNKEILEALVSCK